MSHLEEGSSLFLDASEAESEAVVPTPSGTRIIGRVLVGVSAVFAVGVMQHHWFFATSGSTVQEHMQTIEADSLPEILPCAPGEVSTCPLDWITSATGGYFCKQSGGCSPWTEDGGEFPKEACPQQCSIGVTPMHQTQASATPETPSAVAETPAAAPPTNAEPAVDPNAILPCDFGEAQCPDEWSFGEYGGYYCRQGGGCSPWSKEGGAFAKEACPDQCSIGNTPTTITTTSTNTVSSTFTITSTYPGMGIKLFCWSLAMPGYEFDILRRQKEMYAGIFACDQQMIMSFDKMTVGDGDDKIETAVVEKVAVGTSKDGTAGNALQFMKAWEVIKQDGKYAQNDWTVKVDPDAVLLPDRLRIHLNPHNGGNVYVRNCDKPMSEGTMMFGALEAISKAALDTYYANFDACDREVPWQAWGEDLFMMRCLEHVGVGVAEDFSIIQDGVCKGVWCGDNFAAAFHPMKNVPAWEACWHDAIAAR